MKLQRSSIVLTVILVVGLLAILLIAAHFVVINRFSYLEEEQVNHYINMGTNIVSEQQNVFFDDVITLSAQSDFYKEHLKDEELQLETLHNLKVNYFILIDEAGEEVLSSAFDTGIENQIDFPSGVKEKLIADLKLFSSGMSEGKVGLASLGGETVLTIYQPIVITEGKDEQTAYMALARVLSPEIIKGWGEVSFQDFVLLPVDSSSLDANDEAAIKELTGGKNSYISKKDKLITGYSLKNDFEGNPTFLMKVTSVRGLYEQGLLILRYLIIVALASVVLVGVSSFVVVNKFVLGRIHSLAGEMINLIEKGDYSRRLEEKGNDEIGNLSIKFNEVMAKLLDTQKEAEERNSELLEKVKETEEQAKEQIQTKSAMLNLLEDQRLLEEELRKEKAGVEEKVKERTKELIEAKEKVSQGWMQLQQEKAKLISSINSLSMGFMATDTQGQIVLTNYAVNKILGTPNGVWTLDSVHEKIKGGIDLKGEIGKALTEGKQRDFPEVLMGNQYLRVFIAPIITLAEQSGIIGAVITIEDVTEVKRNERSKEEFFSIASHELRTPLTAIRGNTAMIKDYYPEVMKTKEVAEMIGDIHDSSIRLIQIVNDFLDISRIEQKRIEFKKEAVDLKEVADDVIQQITPIATNKQLTLKVTPPPAKLIAFADKQRVQQVLYNLLGNAIKFTEKGGVEISFVTEGNMVKTKVIDTGAGIPKEKQFLLFQKFQQAADSILTRDVSRSTGLGLYISKLLIEGMGGKIGLESSEPGKGSVFAFALPLATQEQINAQPAQPTQPAPAVADVPAPTPVSENKTAEVVAEKTEDVKAEAPKEEIKDKAASKKKRVA